MCKKTKILILTGILFLLMGCSNLSGSDSKRVTKNVKESNAEERIVLRIISPYSESNTDGFTRCFNQAVEMAKEEFSEYEIVNESYSTEIYKTKAKIGMASLEDFDIFFSWSEGYLKPFAESGYVYPLNHLLEESGYDLTESDQWEGLIFDDVIYGVSLYDWCGVLYYNPYLFNQLNLEPPSTWEELVEDCRQIREYGFVPFALGMKDSWTGHIFVNQMLLQLVGADEYKKIANGESSADYDVWLTIGRYIRELVDCGAFSGGYFNATNDDEVSSFLKGYRAMMFNGSIYGLDKDDKNIAVTSFPLLKECKYDNDYLGKSSFGLCINSRSEHPKEAFEVMMYIVKNSVGLSDLISPWKKTEEQPQTSVGKECLNILDKGKGWGTNFDVLLSAEQKVEFLNIVVKLFEGTYNEAQFADKMVACFSS